VPNSLPNYVLGVPTLEKILAANQFSFKVKALVNLQAGSKIKALCKKLVIDPKIIATVNQAYLKLEKWGWVSVFIQDKKIENIKGEANLWESILELLSAQVKQGQISLEPIYLQAQPQESAAGYAFIDPLHHHLVKIFASWGADYKLSKFCTQDDYDLRSQNIVAQDSQLVNYYYQRKTDGWSKKKLPRNKQHSSPLTKTQLKKIGHLIGEINQKSWQKKTVFWLLYKNQLYIKQIVEQSQPIASKGNSQSALLIGQSVEGGYLEGTVRILQHQVKDFYNQILLAKNLNYSDLNLLKQAAGLILESKDLSPSLHSFIKTHHLPTIIGVNRALSQLKDGQEIVFDAGGGRIYERPLVKTRLITSLQNVCRTYLSAGNPFHQALYPEDSSGIFFKSDYLMLFSGIHPQHLFKDKKYDFSSHLSLAVTPFLEKSRKFFYRSCNLNSQELASLQFNESYEEQPELNPYLGKRGALKIIENDLLFNSEVNMISQLALKTNRNINLVIPFVRTASELALIFHKLKKTLADNPYLKVWLQINTPAVAFNLREFLSLPLAGVVLQSKTVHDLYYGLDPDSAEIYKKYSFDQELIKQVLGKIVLEMKNQRLPHAERELPIVVKLNDYHPEIVAATARLGLEAIVAKPSLEKMISSKIGEIEKQHVDN